MWYVYWALGSGNMWYRHWPLNMSSNQATLVPDQATDRSASTDWTA
jgi:hypothetical protein